MVAHLTAHPDDYLSSLVVSDGYDLCDWSAVSDDDTFRAFELGACDGLEHWCVV